MGNASLWYLNAYIGIIRCLQEESRDEKAKDAEPPTGRLYDVACQILETSAGRLYQKIRDCLGNRLNLGMSLYRGKYRIESARLPGWNYAAAGLYFLTICSCRMECIFGNIIQGTMTNSVLGEIVDKELLKSFEIRQELDCISYVIMPNHLHLIVKIKNPSQFRPSVPGVSSIQPKSISSFVGGFKSAVTSRIIAKNNNSFTKVWHPRFYDHLIRNSDEFESISNYIINNPTVWNKDRFNEKKYPDTNQDKYPENLM